MAGSIQSPASAPLRASAIRIDVDIYERLAALNDADLDRLLLLMVVLCFGQDDLEALDTEQSLFNRLAVDLAIDMRAWWTPDTVFLAMLRRDQLQAMAEELGGASRFTGFKSWSKNELVQALAREFAASTSAEGSNGHDPGPFRTWLPGIFRFPATETVGP